jgi:hypothetical protein
MTPSLNVESRWRARGEVVNGFAPRCWEHQHTSGSVHWVTDPLVITCEDPDHALLTNGEFRVNRFGLWRLEPGGAPQHPLSRRYYFNLSDGDTLLRDTKGVRLPDHGAALRHAQHLAQGFKWIRWSIHVIDEQGRAIGTIE